MQTFLVGIDLSWVTLKELHIIGKPGWIGLNVSSQNSYRIMHYLTISSWGVDVGFFAC